MVLYTSLRENNNNINTVLTLASQYLPGWAHLATRTARKLSKHIFFGCCSVTGVSENIWRLTLCKVLFPFDCCILYKLWSMTWSNLTTGITGIWDKTNFIGRLITDTQLVRKNVTLSYNTKLKIKQQKEKKARYVPWFLWHKGCFHDDIILPLDIKMCLGLALSLSSLKEMGSRVSKFAWILISSCIDSDMAAELFTSTWCWNSLINVSDTVQRLRRTPMNKAE